jgi:hypothetical protein
VVFFVEHVGPRGDPRVWAGLALQFADSKHQSTSALARAVAIAFSWVDERSEVLDNVNKPTAMIVSRIIKESVTTRANP